MEVLLFIITVALLLVVIKLNSFLRETQKENQHKIENIQKLLNKLSAKFESLGAGGVQILDKKEEPTPDVKTATVTQSAKEEKQEVSILPERDENEFESQGDSAAEELAAVEIEPKEEVLKQEPTIAAVGNPQKKSLKEEPVAAKLPEKSKSFFEKYPDIEKFIGENLINKIGIVILVLGLGFLVKYAIDRNWINEVGRVAIGVLAASALIGIAHKLRREYKSFSSVLIGGGLALLYFTIAYAFHTEGYPLYQKQSLSFIILLFVTAFAVFLSLAYNRVEIAILAMLGGFSAPLLISNGSGNYIVLFSYITLLNIGMLVLSYYKKWRLVNIVAFGLTVLLFFLWLSGELIQSHYGSFGGAIFFATGFYVIFFLMNILYNIKNNINFKVGDISLLLCNTVMYFTFSMIMLHYIGDGMYRGLFAVLLALFNFGFAYYIYQRQKADKTLFFLLIGLTLTFATLAVPLQLEGNYITLFWAVESVLLLSLSQKSGFKILKLGSVIVLALMLVSLIMDWYAGYGNGGVSELIIIFNKLFVTTLVSVLSLLAILYLLKNEEEPSVWSISVAYYGIFILTLAFVVTYIGGLLEVSYHSSAYFLEDSSCQVAIQTYNAVFFLLLTIFAFKKKNTLLCQFAIVIGVLFVVVFLASLSKGYAASIGTIISQGGDSPALLLLFRWVSVFSVGAMSILLVKLMDEIKIEPKISYTFLVFTFIYLLSADLDAIASLIAGSKDVLEHTQRTGYAIVWGVSSFVLMIIGMRRKNVTLRVLALVLFGITLLKLFFYDIANISEGGKIVAFILLGILLLIISFMYQKLKKLVVNDEVPSNREKNENIID